ncbi:hypothetical protein QUB63_05775 [Microcoleus sp. ARI1-B5]
MIVQAQRLGKGEDLFVSSCTHKPKSTIVGLWVSGILTLHAFHPTLNQRLSREGFPAIELKLRVGGAIGISSFETSFT